VSGIQRRLKVIHSRTSLPTTLTFLPSSDQIASSRVASPGCRGHSVTGRQLGRETHLLARARITDTPTPGALCNYGTKVLDEIRRLDFLLGFDFGGFGAFCRMDGQQLESTRTGYVPRRATTHGAAEATITQRR
jgi:hypothetical protein